MRVASILELAPNSRALLTFSKSRVLRAGRAAAELDG